MEELLYYQSRCEVLERQNKDLIVRIIDIQKELKELKGQNRLLVGTIKENETIHKSS
jgi:hypothetical protein